MRRWVIEQLGTLRGNRVVVLDPSTAATDEEITQTFGADAEIVRITNWLQLRRAWERSGRRRAHDASTLAIIVSDPDIMDTTDLPYDVERAADVSRVRVPGTVDVRAALLALDPATSDEAVRRMRVRGMTPLDALLTAATALPAGALAGGPARQFQMALRLRRRTVVDELGALALNLVEDPLARAVLQAPPDVRRLQQAWEDWLRQPGSSEWAGHFSETAAEIVELLRDGILEPADFDPHETPAWTALGLRGRSASARVESLMDGRPAVGDDLAYWFRVATWWGEIRNGLAEGVDAELVARAWSEWDTLDERFQAWLRASYGLQLSRAWADGPQSVDKIRPFLERRLQAAERVAVIVLDGMGFSQWAQIRRLADIRVLRSGGCLAMLPTLTEVSRQSLAAGGLPSTFPRSLDTTRKEAELWRAGRADASWIRLHGRAPQEIDTIPFADARMLAIVVGATDDLVHSSAVLGDLGLHASIATWMRMGFLRDILGRAHTWGFEIWIASDHGNLQVTAAPAPREGVFVSRAGTRVRQYTSKALRDSARIDGLTWDELPGYPPDQAARLLFAPGRTAWTSASISHGGLSLDEIIVPFAQVVPA